MSCQDHQPDSDTPAVAWALALALLPAVTLADDAGAIAVGNKGDGGPVTGAGAEADVTALQNAHTSVSCKYTRFVYDQDSCRCHTHTSALCTYNWWACHPKSDKCRSKLRTSLLLVLSLLQQHISR